MNHALVFAVPMRAFVVAALSLLSTMSMAVWLSPSVTSHSHPTEVVGLWSRWPAATSDGDRVRFYFFHETGIGLYRYGKIGLNTTNSFHWHVEGHDMVLTFQKTGEVRRTPYALTEHGQGQPRSLAFSDDPQEPLIGAVSYTYVPLSRADLLAADLFPAQPLGDDKSDRGIGGRMWINMTTYATGGSAFSIYQLKETAIDGRGVGWHHVGDFDDWSTEALAFRFSPGSCREDAHLDLAFSVRGDRASTQVLKKDGALVLVEDPRSFWHVRAYKDGGKSFQFLPTH